MVLRIMAYGREKRLSLKVRGKKVGRKVGRDLSIEFIYLPDIVARSILQIHMYRGGYGQLLG